jgi:hypothetical protein
MPLPEWRAAAGMRPSGILLIPKTTTRFRLPREPKKALHHWRCSATKGRIQHNWIQKSAAQRRTVRDAESPKASLARLVTVWQRTEPLSVILRVTLRRLPKASVPVRVTLTEALPSELRRRVTLRWLPKASVLVRVSITEPPSNL